MSVKTSVISLESPVHHPTLTMMDHHSAVRSSSTQLSTHQRAPPPVIWACYHVYQASAPRVSAATMLCLIGVLMFLLLLNDVVTYRRNNKISADYSYDVLTYRRNNTISLRSAETITRGIDGGRWLIMLVELYKAIRYCHCHCIFYSFS